MQMNTPLGPTTNVQQQQLLQQQLLFNQQQFLNQQNGMARPSTSLSVSSLSGTPAGPGNPGSILSQQMMMNGGASLLHQQNQIRPMVGNQPSGGNFNPQMSLGSNSNINHSQLRYRPNNQILRPPYHQQPQQPQLQKQQPPVNLMRSASQMRPPSDPEAIAAAKILAETREHALEVKSRFVLL
jgi:hypothetical protein